MALEGVQLTAGMAALLFAFLLARSARNAWDRYRRRQLAAASAGILALADAVLQDVEQALHQLGCSDFVTDADDNIQLDACVERLTEVLMRAAAIASRATELSCSPRIARNRRASEVLRLLRIHADRIAALRLSADEELHRLRGWLERSWAETHQG